MTSQKERARSAYMRSYRSTGRDIDVRKAQHKACALAVAWVRREHPEVWDEILNEGYRLTGGERRRPGRPSKADSQ